MNQKNSDQIEEDKLPDLETVTAGDESGGKEAVQEKCFEYCKQASQCFEQIDDYLSTMQSSTAILEMFKAGNNELSTNDFYDAKKEFDEAKKEYLRISQELTTGITYVYRAQLKYPEELLLKQLYCTFLAKLLASRKSRNPVERYIRRLAEKEFLYQIPDFNQQSDNEDEDGPTSIEQYKDELIKNYQRLEARYRKWKLMQNLHEGFSKKKLIEELTNIQSMDEDDIRTYILLARIYGDMYLETGVHTEKTLSLRKRALDYCSLIMEKLDAFLDLQHYDDKNECEVSRLGFVKTVFDIRSPLSQE